MRKVQEKTFYTLGRRRMHVVLKKIGLQVNMKRIYRLMQVANLASVIRRPKNMEVKRLQKDFQGNLPDNILSRHFMASRSGVKYVTDVTYVPYVENGEYKYGYLSVVLDLFDRRVVSWVYSKTQDMSLAMKTLQIVSMKGFKQGAIMHSDRGSIYTSSTFKNKLERLGMVQSLSRSGNCHDNAVIESFNGIFKVECLRNKRFPRKGKDFYSVNEMIRSFMRYYNTIRLRIRNAQSSFFVDDSAFYNALRKALQI